MNQVPSQNLLPNFYPKPKPKQLKGLYCTLQPFDKNTHALDLYKAFLLDKEGKDWLFLPYGPFPSESSFLNWVDLNCLGNNAMFYSVCTNENSNPSGMLSLFKIEPQHGKAELGYVHFSQNLQQTTASTESLYLVMKFFFNEMNYRRLEWKCDNANERSKRCAIRLGFTFEGVFRQHWIVKSRNRDTAWYSIIDKEWPHIKTRLERWLDPKNFKRDGHQIKKLAEL